MEINALNESSAQFCMICLDTHSKLYPASKHNLDMEYESLTGILLAEVFSFAPMFCSECARRLNNCCKFREKSLRAFQLLSELVQSNAVLSLQTLSSVDRVRCRLTSSVVRKMFEPNHCDLYVTEDTESNDKVIMKNEEIDEKLHVKCKTDFYLEIECGDNGDDAAEFTADDVNTDVEITNDDAKDVNVVYIDDSSNDDLYNHKGKMQGVEQSNTNESHKNEPKILNHKITTDITNAEWLKDMDDDIDIDFDINEDIQRAHKVNRRDGNKKRVAKRKQPSSDKRKPPRKRGRKKISLPPQKTEEPKCVKIKGFRKIERSPEEQVADWTQKQERERYRDAPYKCTNCYKCFTVEKTYNSHMEKHTDKYGAFECHICRVRVKSRGFLLEHHSRTHKFLYHCTECAFVTNCSNTAHNHSHWHGGKTYECKDCGKVFAKRSTYYGHLRFAHPSDTVCALCGYSFVNKRGLWMHQKKGHRDDTQELSGPQCEQCDVRFASEAAYETHLQVSPKHGAPGDLKKNDASLGILRESRLSREEGTSRRQSIINCVLCNAVLENRTKYYWHLRRSHPDSDKTKRDFMCEQCGKLCVSSFHLQEHTLTHGSRKVQCDACNKKFYSLNALRGHMLRTHNAQRRDTYACAHCAYQTKEKGNFVRHMQVHLDSNARRWFRCTLCEKKTTTRQMLQDHVLHVHQNVPRPPRLRASRPRAAVPRTRATDSSES